MANKRMFSNAVIDQDEFCGLSKDAQLLYFHLGMKADDDGFVPTLKICKLLELGEQPLSELAQAGYIIRFQGDRVIAISHWKINNELKKDRYHATPYQGLKSQLGINSNNVYYLLDTDCIHDGDETDTQYSVTQPSVIQPSEKSVTQPSGGERSEAPTLGGLAESQSTVAEQLIGRLRGAGITDPAKINRVHQLIRDKGPGAASDYVDQEIGRR